MVILDPFAARRFLITFVFLKRVFGGMTEMSAPVSMRYRTPVFLSATNNLTEIDGPIVLVAIRDRTGHLVFLFLGAGWFKFVRPVSKNSVVIALNGFLPSACWAFSAI